MSHVLVQLRGFNERLSIREGGLPAREYILEQLHFHVGAEDGRGSEHDVNGEFFEVEVKSRPWYPYT